MFAIFYVLRVFVSQYLETTVAAGSNEPPMRAEMSA